jgi:hypothetical protein
MSRHPLCENRIMRMALIAVVLIPAGLFAQEPMATVTIHVIDKDGYAVEKCRVDRFERLDDLNTKHHDLDVTSHFSGLRGDQVPFGTYDYQLKRSLEPNRDGIASGRIAVYRKEVLAVIQANTELQRGFSVDGVRIADQFGIEGRLEPMPQQTSEIDPIRIRLSPIHGGEQFDVSVESSGKFRIYNAPNGRYILSVIRGNDLLAVQPITFRSVAKPQPFVVKLLNRPLDEITIYEATGNQQ